MELIEILTDLYFAVGSAISSISDKMKSYTKLLRSAIRGNAQTLNFLRTIPELDSTIVHEKDVRILLINQMVNQNGITNIHCILLNGNAKFVNSLDLKVRTNLIPPELYKLPQMWNL